MAEHEVFQVKAQVFAGNCAACREDLTGTVHQHNEKLYHPSCCPECKPGQTGLDFAPPAKVEYPD